MTDLTSRHVEVSIADVDSINAALGLVCQWLNELGGQQGNPQDVNTGASPTFAGLTLSGLTASRLVGTNAAKALASSDAPGDSSLYARKNYGWTALTPAYGSMYADNIGVTMTISAPDTPVEVQSGMTGGAQLNCTFQNNHEIRADLAGHYLIMYSMSFEAVTAGKEFEGALMIENVHVAQGTAHAEISIGGAHRPETVGGNGIFLLAVGDRVSLSVENHTDTVDLVLQHASLSMVWIAP